MPIRQQAGLLVVLVSALTTVLAFTEVLHTTVMGVHAPFVAVYWTPIILVVALYTASARWREWMLSLDVRELALLHGIRWAGFGTVCLAAYGLTSPLWAVSAGIGDMVAALGLTVLAWRGYRDGQVPRRAVIAWNLFGIADFLHVLVLATLLIPSAIGVLAGPEPRANASLALAFPFSLVPIVIVPWLFAAHIVALLIARRSGETMSFRG